MVTIDLLLGIHPAQVGLSTRWGVAMNVRVMSAVLEGIEGIPVDVEVDVHQGLGQFDIVGLPEAVVRESKVRVLSAIRNLGHRMATRRITVNLAPADVKKHGSFFDLPVALGVLACLEAFPPAALEGRSVLGELSLDGTVRPVSGVLPMVAAAAERGVNEVVVPYANAAEASLVRGVRALAVRSLPDLLEFLAGRGELPEAPSSSQPQVRKTRLDLSDVCGQAHVKRALEIAAAGRHNLLMIGPPGSGKTMLARRLSTILPDLTYEERLETTKVHSVAGLLRRHIGLLEERPFRAPHHTASAASIAGGGTRPRPGEVSLAHHGVLFLDELPEWKRDVLEVLRQPMEEQLVTITRASGSVTYPADFLLIAAMNPCPCGYLGDPRHQCTCSAVEVQRYRARISGPLLDRIDIHIEVPAVPFRDLANRGPCGETSEEIRRRVVAATAIQAERFAGSTVRFNSRMDPKQVRTYCAVAPEATRLLEAAMDKLGLSARALDRILKVSRTIADLDGSEAIRTVHVAEAIQYRSLDRVLR